MLEVIALKLFATSIASGSKVFMSETVKLLVVTEIRGLDTLGSDSALCFYVVSILLLFTVLR